MTAHMTNSQSYAHIGPFLAVTKGMCIYKGMQVAQFAWDPPILVITCL